MKDSTSLRQAIIDVCLKLREQKYVFGDITIKSTKNT